MTDGSGPDDAVVRSTWEEGENPSSAVVDAVVAATGRDLTDARPLYDYVESDALDAVLVAARENGRAVTVRFDYDGVEVVVDSDGGIEVSSADAA
jgi:hypothetical protein